MSLFMPLTTDQYHAKPMAISSITSPISRSREDVSSAATASATAADTTATAVPDYNDINSSPPLTCGSPSISSSQSDTITPPTAGSSSSKSGSSSPPSRTFSNYSSSSNYSSPGSPNQSNSNLLLTKNTRSSSASLPQPPIMATSFYHPYHYSGSSNSSNSNNNTTQPPLSIHERRLRNKTASAKYRAKKNQQHGEMRAMISTLTKENELLLRQLDHIQHENSHLKATCDRLRGKIMAQKMLKQYLVENEQQQQQQQQQQNHHRQQQQMSMDQGHQQPPNCFVQYHNAAPIVSSNSKYPEINKEKKRGDLNIRSQNEAMNFH